VEGWGATKTRFAPKVLRAKLLARTHPTNLSFVSKKPSRVIMDFESGWWATAHLQTSVVDGGQQKYKTHPTNKRKGWWATPTLQMSF